MAECSRHCHDREATLSVLDLCFEVQCRTSLRAHRTIQKSSSKHKSLVHRSSANYPTSDFLPETAFFQTHRLISATLSPPTRKAYTQAYRTFFQSITHLPQNASQIEKTLCTYIEDNFKNDPSPDRRQNLSYVICFLSHVRPDLKGCLGLSHRALTGWSIARFRRLLP